MKTILSALVGLAILAGAAAPASALTSKEIFQQIESNPG